MAEQREASAEEVTALIQLFRDANHFYKNYGKPGFDSAEGLQSLQERLKPFDNVRFYPQQNGVKDSVFMDVRGLERQVQKWTKDQEAATQPVQVKVEPPSSVVKQAPATQELSPLEEMQRRNQLEMEQRAAIRPPATVTKEPEPVATSVPIAVDYSNPASVIKGLFDHSVDPIIISRASQAIRYVSERLETGTLGDVPGPGYYSDVEQTRLQIGWMMTHRDEGSYSGFKDRDTYMAAAEKYLKDNGITGDGPFWTEVEQLKNDSPHLHNAMAQEVLNLTKLPEAPARLDPAQEETLTGLIKKAASHEDAAARAEAYRELGNHVISAGLELKDKNNVERGIEILKAAAEMGSKHAQVNLLTIVHDGAVQGKSLTELGIGAHIIAENRDLARQIMDKFEKDGPFQFRQACGTEPACQDYKTLHDKVYGAAVAPEQPSIMQTFDSIYKSIFGP
ncbi:MAG: hypothetical protein LRZ85_08655 [Alphaproteobacteria bacterium]|nr:hypothetical protein [Alphaproteobacteria bacterium]MCD8519887.1 hypothetical protein [Alphaproteobacteria bacterium]MCD8526133.1 hypothetical protein [Alphaproteobacteria bacterium]